MGNYSSAMSIPIQAIVTYNNIQIDLEIKETKQVNNDIYFIFRLPSNIKQCNDIFLLRIYLGGKKIAELSLSSLYCYDAGDKKYYSEKIVYNERQYLTNNGTIYVRYKPNKEIKNIVYKPDRREELFEIFKSF